MEGMPQTLDQSSRFSVCAHHEPHVCEPLGPGFLRKLGDQDVHFRHWRLVEILSNGAHNTDNGGTETSSLDVVTDWIFIGSKEFLYERLVHHNRRRRRWRVNLFAEHSAAQQRDTKCFKVSGANKPVFSQGYFIGRSGRMTHDMDLAIDSPVTQRQS